MLAADLGIVHVMLIFRYAECKNCGIREASVQISKKDLRGQLWTSERVCEAVGKRLKVQERPQEVGVVRNIDHLLRKVMDNE